MIVTRIEEVTTKKYRVFLDEQFAFVLYKGELMRYKLTVDSEIEQDVYEAIMKEVILKRAKQRALHILETSSKTEAELIRKLREGEYPEEIVTHAVAYVKSYGYINDQRYAEHYLLLNKERRSRKEIRFKLLQKGVSPEIIDQVIENHCVAEDTERAIRKYLEKQKVTVSALDRSEKQKLMGKLARKGFSYEEISRVFQDDCAFFE